MSNWSWTNAEAAIYTWATTALQAANNGTPVPTLWVQQSQVRPLVGPFATLKRGGSFSVGTVDETQVTATGGTPSAGQELTYTTQAVREFALSLQVFTVDVYGDLTATSLAEAAQIALNQPLTVAALNAAGVSVVDKGTVQNLTGLLENKFEGRASLDVKFRAIIPATQFGGYIATAQTTGTFNP